MGPEPKSRMQARRSPVVGGTQRYWASMGPEPKSRMQVQPTATEHAAGGSFNGA